MTLSQLLRKYFITGIIITMLIGCISHFVIFRIFTHRYNDVILYEYKKGIEEYVEENDNLQLYTSTMLNPPRVEERLIKNPLLYPEEIKDTVLYNSLTKKYRSYRQLYFTIHYKNQWHQVNVNQPIIKSNDLLFIIILSLFLVFILLFIFTYIIGFFLKKEIGVHFYKNLNQLRNYDMKANTVLNLTKYKVEELNEYNEVIMRMVKKINEEYENSKIFIEDASHEMQTPLSIINSNLDHLIQSHLINDEEQMKNLSSILRATKRLSRLNRSLSLLTKINNDQFQDKEIIDIKSLIESYLLDLTELIQAKNIHISQHIEPLLYKMSPILADKLISNLLSNAIRHNKIGGFINIELTPEYLLIENDCIQPISTKNLFNRMVHREKSEESTGLGLNIVKSICDKNQLQIHYTFLPENIFQIKIHFLSNLKNNSLSKTKN